MAAKKYVWNQDQAEWYILCEACYEANKEYQWSGSTRVPDYLEYKRSVVEPARQDAEKCEFCGREFGGPPTEKTGRCQFTRMGGVIT